MMCVNRWSRCARAMLFVAATGLSLGQRCSSPSSNSVPVASACGLSATYCVEVIGKSPLAMTGGDFNGDGLPDGAVANFGTDNLEVLLNDGGGVIEAAGRYKAGNSPGAIVAADFNGDGVLDLAASDGLGIAVLIGQGDGTFGSAVYNALDQTINAFPVSVATADFDGDGDADLAAAGIGWTLDYQAGIFTNADNVAVFLNDGTGDFTLASTVIIGNTYPRLGDIAAGDVDGDGLPDIVVDQSSGRVTVLINQGEGQFVNAYSVLVGEDHLLSDAKLADLDGDGRLDLVVADNGDMLDSGNIRGTVTVYRNRDGQAFDSVISLVTGEAPTSVAIADYNGNGWPDLAVVNNLSNDLVILVNQGGGIFGFGNRFTIGEGPTSVTPADFDGDGDLDLAVSHMMSGAVGVYLNNGAACFNCDQ